MERLLTYSFDVPYHNLHSIVDGSFIIPKRYSHGVIISNIPSLNNDQQQQRSKNIKINDRLLPIFAMFSLIVWLLTEFDKMLNKRATSIEATCSLLLFFSLYALHYPGRKGLATKIAVSTLQISLFVNQASQPSQLGIVQDQPEFSAALIHN